ncbi:MAG: biopolymer transporter ExbD [Lentisphaeraceae bacterium]|nr:biopolymer transporter ExbD [Lentisphaeraceae bacterium]
MKVKGATKASVPISAMIDVVFLLLVFFVVTSQEVINEAFVSVNLPGKSVDPPPENIETTALDLYVLEDSYKISGQTYTLSKMESLIRVYSESIDKLKVNVKVSEKASHQQLVLALDSLHGAGVEDFGIYTLK